MKANWGRVKKEEGLKSMNTTITSQKNPIIDVDPFGPPLLANAKNQPPSQTSAKLALPAPQKTTPEKFKEASTSKKTILKKENATTEEEDEDKKLSQEEISIKSRPKSGMRRSPKKSRKHSKSKSPKRVSISEDLPTRKSIKEDDDNDEVVVGETIFTTSMNTEDFDDDDAELP
jgi:hypothetical protein